MKNKNNPNNNRSMWLKIGLCIIGVLMIAGAVTYTILTKQTSPSSASSIQPATSETAQQKKSTGVIDGLNWVNKINAEYTDKDFLFVLLPGDIDQTKETEQIVSVAMDKIRQSGASVDVFSLEPDDQEVDITAKRLAITQLPAVMLFSSQGRGAIVSGDITETKLLQAYLTLVQACVPGNSGCCPK